MAILTFCPNIKCAHYECCYYAYIKFCYVATVKHNLCVFYFIVTNVFIGLFLFGDKIANPQDMNAYWVFVALVSAFWVLDVAMGIYFGYSRYYCPEKTQPVKEVDQSETEMKKIGESDDSSPPPPSKKTPSPVRSSLGKIYGHYLSNQPTNQPIQHTPQIHIHSVHI